MIPFVYRRPATLAEAVDILASYDGQARVHAGGTDLLVGLRKGKLKAKCVVDLKNIRELDAAISVGHDTVRFGALSVMTQIAADPRIRKHLPALVDAAVVVGSIQIRNRATLAGNICNASPAADTVPPLLVYDTTVSLYGPKGERQVPLHEFFIGPGKTAKENTEIVTALETRVPRGRAGAAFGRLTRRLGVDLATINLACLVHEDRMTRFGWGAVGPTPILAADETRRLAAVDATDEERAEVLAAMLRATSPISDVRSGREYREAMLTRLSTKALNEALARANGRPA